MNIRATLKHYFDRIRSEKFKHLLLQAFPFWVASLLTGIIAVLYTKLFAWAEQGASWLFHLRSWLIFLMVPVCFFIAVWLVRRFAPFSRGSGIPQVMMAIELSTPKKIDLVGRFLSLRIIFVKIISSCFMALGGGVIGREGPTIQIAGSIFRKVNAMLPEWWPKISKRNMIMTGAAAGLASAFNTPLGGIVFAMEELTKTHISFYKTAIFSAVIIAGFTAQALLGPYLYIGYPDLKGLLIWVALPVLLVSLLAGAFSAIMCKIMIRIMRWKNTLVSGWKIWGYVFICAMALAVMAFTMGEQTLHSGKELITGMLFTADKYVHWYTPFLRMAGSVFSFTSGGAGGVFAPALCAGASIGSVISHWMHLTAPNTNLLILAGMVAFLTGVTRTPFTSAVLVLEMTDGHNIIFYLMLSGLAANLIAYFIDKHSFYDHMKKSYASEVEEKG
jgi:H+/Cl- antiporter ClcA